MKTIVRHNLRLILCLIGMCCSLWGCGQGLLSAQAPDTTSVKKGPKGFNALQYVNQGIWKGRDLPFSNKHWHDNLYIYAGTGPEVISSNRLNLGMGVNSYFGVGKDLSRNHTLRLAVDYTTNGRVVGEPLRRWGFSVSHLFNITSYTSGYDPNRRLEFSTLAGLGFQNSTLEDRKGSGLRGWVGFQAKYHASRHIDYALEPFLAINAHKLMMAETADRMYQMTYGATINMRYKWHHDLFEYRDRSSHLIYGNFYTISLGAQMQLSDLEGKGMGPAIGLGIGRWLMPGLGLKLSAIAANDTWHAADYTAEQTKDEPYQRHESTFYGGGQVEAVFEPFIFFNKIDDDRKFQLRILAGASLGMMSKKNYNSNIREMFWGPTAALQFAFRCDEDKLFYIEPRFTMAQYRVPYERVRAFKNFADNLVSISLGLEIGEPVISRKRVNASLNQYFVRKLLFSVDGGANMPLMSQRYGTDMLAGLQLGLTAHYLLSPLNSVGLHADYSNVVEDQEKGTQNYKVISTALQYRLDVTNAILGYDPDRKVHLTFFAGPLASMRLRLKKPMTNAPVTPVLPEEPVIPDTPDLTERFFTRAEDELPEEGGGDLPVDEGGVVPMPKDETSTAKLFFGAEVGFQIRYNFSEYVGIYVAPQLRLLPSDFLPYEKHGWDKVASISAGIQFRL